jgi:hypothetical protein
LAVEEFVVVCPESGGRAGETQRKWSGAAAGSFINDSNIKTGAVVIVNAESAAEALAGIKQLYPGFYGAKALTVLKASMTEA